MVDTYYKYAGFWWTFDSFFDEPSASQIKGPYCINCHSDLDFPGDAYKESSDPEVRWEFDTVWKGDIICRLCSKKHKWEGGELWELKKRISLILISNFRQSLEKVALDEPVSQVKVRDQDDKYFLAAKIGQKDGKRVGVVYFGEKSKDQNKKDYSQIFVDLDDEQIRFDKSNKHPKDILAMMKVEFQHSLTRTSFKVPVKK